MKFPPRRLLGTAGPFLVFLAAFLTYDHVLTYFWTAPDTYSLILAGRIESLADLGRILSEPLMSRSKVHAMYYRPLSTLTFSLDYALWGLRPFGYHLTNLVLHGLVAVMIYVSVRTLHRGRAGTALLAGLLYTSHPILMEIVPGIERRQDLLPMVLMLAALTAAVQAGCSNAEGSPRRFLGVGLYGLTLAAKEIGIILLPLLGLYRYLFRHRRGTVLERLRKTLRSLVDYVLVTVFYLAWWFSVAGSSALSHGGIARNFIVKETMLGTLRQLVTWGWLRVYLGSLYPWQPWLEELVSFRGALEAYWFHPEPLTGFLSGVILTGILAMLWLCGRRRIRSFLRSPRLQGILLAGLVLLFVSLVALPALNLIGQQIVRQAYQEPGLPLITGLMEGRGDVALETYLLRLENRLARWGHRLADGFLLAALAAVLVSLWRHRDDYLQGITPRRMRWGVWYGAWILLPGVLYTAGLNFAFRLMYPVVIPVCIGLAHFVVLGFRWGLTTLGGGESWQPRLDRCFVLLVVLVVFAGGVRYSPWFERYPGWDCAQTVAERYLAGLDRELAGLGSGDRVLLDPIPMNLIALKANRPRVHSAGIFGVDSIPAWLMLKGHWHDRSYGFGEFEHVRGRCPAEVRLNVQRTSKREILLEARW